MGALIHMLYFSGNVPQIGQRLVDAWPNLCKIVMVDMMLLIHLLMKCDIWTLVLSHDGSNDVRSIPSQFSM